MARTLILSPYFDQNVHLVAGMCSKCYEEQTEVKIISINSAFLRQTIKTKKILTTKLRSPHNLLEESLDHNPWGLLVATIFLNKTSCYCARPLLEKFLKDYPEPSKVLERTPDDIEEYFKQLGLRKRAIQIWRMSHDFLYKKWSSVGELYGIGRYGEDAFRMFCLGDFSVEPQDRFLRIYRAWYLQEKT